MLKEKEKKEKRVKKVLTNFVVYWLPIILWMTLIFTFSSFSVPKSSNFYWQDFIVKKTAHVMEYAMLSALTFRALINSGVKSTKNAILIAIFTTFLYGISDEFHQSFTPGREPRVRDVMIDLGGNILSLFIICKISEYKKSKIYNVLKGLKFIK